MVNVSVAIGVTLILYVAYRLFQHLFPPPNLSARGKHVLITGCDTGFGHALAIELDKKGFCVFAGVYNSDNEEHLTAHLSTRATVFCLDITQQEEIDAAYDMVKGKTNVLHALVNNAGISTAGLIDWTTVDSMRKTMEINYFGHVAMTKKFLPLLLTRRGSRVINVCSVSGFLAGPGVAAYAASKYALEAFSDSLRREMHAWGLHVSLVEPGFMRTPIIEGHDNTYRELWSQLDDDTKKRWGGEYFNSFLTQSVKNTFISNAENPNKVIKTLCHAVMNSAPRIRYRPGWQSSLFFFPLSMLPAWIADFIVVRTGGAGATPAGIFEQQG